MNNEPLLEKCKTSNDASCKRFVNYIMSRSTSKGLSAQTACFDTLTQRSVFASDFFFKPEELKCW